MLSLQRFSWLVALALALGIAAPGPARANGAPVRTEALVRTRPLERFTRRAADLVRRTMRSRFVGNTRAAHWYERRQLAPIRHEALTAGSREALADIRARLASRIPPSGARDAQRAAYFEATALIDRRDYDLR